MLGRYPAEPRLRRELLIAVTDGDLTSEASEVDTFLETNFGAVQQMTLMAGDAEVRPIEYWLDLPGLPGWMSFGHAGNNLCFLVDGLLRITAL